MLTGIQCKFSDTETDYSDFIHVVKKGAFECYIPKYLHQDKTLNPKAIVAYSDSLNNTFIMIIREEIPDTENDSIVISPENYHVFACAAIRDQLQDFNLISHSSPTLNLVPALISEFKGTFSGHQLFYSVTSLKSTHYFYQIISWSLVENQAVIGVDLRLSALSFKPID